MRLAEGIRAYGPARTQGGRRGLGQPSLTPRRLGGQTAPRARQGQAGKGSPEKRGRRLQRKFNLAADEMQAIQSAQPSQPARRPASAANVQIR